MNTHTPIPAPRPNVGPILGHPTHPRIRFFMADGDGTGAGGSTGNPDGTGGAGSTGNPPAVAPTPEDLAALRGVADKRLQERNAARDEAKAYRDLGLTVEEIADLKAARDKANGGPTPEQIAAQARKEADADAAERYASKARASAVREAATALGFHNPKAALAMLDPKALAAVPVDDDEADAKAVGALLEALAKAEPYLVKTTTPPTADWRAAGIGGVGSTAKAEPSPGLDRIRSAYETTSR